MAAPVYTLGINAYDHDVSAALAQDGEIVVAINKERITRVKHDTGFYSDPVAYCLLAAGITLDDVAFVVRNSYLLPVQELEAVFRSYASSKIMTARDRAQAERSVLYCGDDPRVVDISHHLAHAYSAFAASPFARGAVMVTDGVGSHREDVVESVPPHCDAVPLARESESYYAFEGKQLRTIRKAWLAPTKSLVNDDFFMMAGLGALYSRVSSYIFGHWNRCGEVMGLAPYGRQTMEPLVELEGDDLRLRPWGPDLCHPYEGGNDHTWKHSPHRRHWEDLAWRIQEDTERVLVRRAQRLHEEVGGRDLTLAGGVALNCVANGKILAETPFERIFVQPAAGDDGIAIGCALYGWLELHGGERRAPMTHAFLGMTYPPERIERAATRPLVRMTAQRRRGAEVIEAVADLLAAGRVVGWFDGGSEFGPRALGHRSILADPRKAAMRDHINIRVKNRQEFRPFAPAVLAEHAHEWFVSAHESPFMLLATDVRPEKRAEIAAVTHVDGTARVQTVHRATNPRLHALISAFAARTGVPILLNTSFNDRGEPVVETPGDAVDTFLATELDALCLQDILLVKRALHRTLRPLLRRYKGFRQGMRHDALRKAAALHVLSQE
ncbi:MAG: carbamoyltransferase [Planctomycetota bacterium]|nr:carbamoyltransferase [Planctomycetota bacterium]